MDSPSLDPMKTVYGRQTPCRGCGRELGYRSTWVGGELYCDTCVQAKLEATFGDAAEKPLPPCLVCRCPVDTKADFSMLSGKPFHTHCAEFVADVNRGLRDFIKGQKANIYTVERTLFFLMDQIKAEHHKKKLQ